MTPHQLADIIRRAHAIGEHPENQYWTHVYPREWRDMIVAALEAFGAAQAEPKHDHRVYFGCECCEEHAPENGVNCREDIGVMPDGTWLCDGCYSDCDKSAYGMIASDVDDFEFPRFEDLPRPAVYALPSTQENAGAAQAEKEAREKEITRLATIEECARVADYYASVCIETTTAERDGYARNRATLVAEKIRALALPSTQEKPLSVCSRCEGKDPDCCICGTAEGK
jgi:hypothetical protein